LLVRSHRASFVLGATLTALAVSVGMLAGVLPRLDAGRPAEAAGAASAFVPSDLRPSLRGAFDDVPETWRNGCHVGIAATRPKECVYGDPNGATTVVLFGDSHAASWFGAFKGAAEEAGWRLLTFTKSGCPAASVPQWRAEVGRSYTECDQWRAAALEMIAKEHKPIVVLAGSRDSNVQVEDEWRTGYERTIASLPADARPMILADTPRSGVNVPVCLSGHLDDAAACSLPRADAVDEDFRSLERDIAEETHATFIDTLPWVCATFPCPMIRGNLLVLRDTNHLSSPFSASLASEVLGAISQRPSLSVH